MRQSLIRLMALLLVVVPFLGVWANESSAASTRVAVIKELKGTVKVKKAGGSKEFTAFAKMSLNEGDVLSVGSSGSAVLQFANGTSEDDKMTVGDNTRLSFSKLSNKKGTTTKVSMWSGSAWVDVKSIANKDDQFTLETPTAVMGVRGTHFMTSVNPLTGSTQLSVGAGIVSMMPPVPNLSVPQPPQFIYPNQTILALPNLTGLPTIVPAPIDPSILVNQAGAALIEAMLKASIEIQQENARLMSQYTKDLGILQPDLDRIQNNINHLVSVIVNQALTAKIIQQNAIDKIQDELLKNAGQKMDLSIKELQLTNEEKQKQEIQREAEKKAKEEAEKKKQEEAQSRNKELVEKIKKQQEEQKKAAEEAIKKKQEAAFIKYESQLSDSEKERLRRDKNNLPQAQVQSPSPIIPGGNGGGPTPPSYINPLQSLTVSHERQLGEYEWIDIEYEVPLDKDNAEYAISDRTKIITLSLEKASAFADYDVKVSVNGTPYAYEGSNTEFTLTRVRNEITIDLKPHGEIASSNNTKRFTLFVTIPSLPEGFSFTTSTDGEDLIWEPLGLGHFKAITTTGPIGSITFNPTFNGSAVEGILVCGYYEDCNYEISGLTARNLVDGEVYQFTVDMGDTSLYFELVNHVAEPDWQQLFIDNIEFRENFSEDPSVHFGSQGGEQYADVSFLAKRLYMKFYGDLKGNGQVWDERDWTKVNWTSNNCNDCDSLQRGDNRFTLYVNYDDIYEHRYVLNIHKNDPPLSFSWIEGDNNEHLEERYAGNNTWIIHAPVSEDTINLEPMFEYLTITGSSETGGLLEEALYEGEMSVVQATYLQPNSVNVFNVNISNPLAPEETYSPSKLIIYNGIDDLHPTDFMLNGFEYTYPDDLYMESVSMTINPADPGLLPAGKEFVGVFDDRGNKIYPINNVYQFYPGYYEQHYYVVVKDKASGIMMPTNLTITTTN